MHDGGGNHAQEPISRSAFLATLFCGSTLAQTWPTKPVKLIVTYPPGGSSDLLARVFGQKLSEIWGQPVIVESKPGAAGSIGMEYASKQAPDGYSFVVGNIGPAAINPLLSKLGYDVERDFVAISLIATDPTSSSSTRACREIVPRADRFRQGELRKAQLRDQRSGKHFADFRCDAQDPHRHPGRGSSLQRRHPGGAGRRRGHIQFIFSDSLPAMQFIRARRRGRCA